MYIYIYIYIKYLVKLYSISTFGLKVCTYIYDIKLIKNIINIKNNINFKNSIQNNKNNKTLTI